MTAAEAQDRPTLDILIYRGVTESMLGTVTAGADPECGEVLQDMRIKEGDVVQKGEVIGKLSGLPDAQYELARNEAELKRQLEQRVWLAFGARQTEIDMQRARLAMVRNQNKLQALERAQTNKSPEAKEIEKRLDDQMYEREVLKLRILVGKRDTELQELDAVLSMTRAAIEGAQKAVEQCIVRAPIAGTVVKILSRRGERVAPAGVAKVVDFSQLQVIADLDEFHLNRVLVGGLVEMTFRGSAKIYGGKVSRIAPIVKRMGEAEETGTSPFANRAVQVEINFDHMAGIPPFVGREVRVHFL